MKLTTRMLAWIAVMLVVLLFLGESNSSAQSFGPVVRALQMSPNAEIIAVGTFAGDIVLYEVASGKIIQSLQHEEHLTDLQWSPDGQQIAAVTYSGQVAIWAIHSNTPTLKADHPLHNGVIRINWSPDGGQIAVTSQGGGTAVIDAVTGDELYSLQTGDTTDSLWSPAPYLITADLVGLRVWDSQTVIAQILGTRNGTIEGNLPSGVALSPLGNIIALHGSTPPMIDSTGISNIGMVLQIYTFPEFELINAVDLLLPDRTSVIRLEWSRDGRYIAMSSTDGYIRTWDADLTTLVSEILVGDSGWAFDWLNDSEIVFAAEDSELSVVQAVDMAYPMPFSQAQSAGGKVHLDIAPTGACYNMP